MNRILKLVTAAAVLAAAAGSADAGTLDFRFIGNEAFEITDGETTLFTDFPYRPGYAGYMYYGLREVKRRADSLCLITHRHLDHFDRNLMKRVECTVVGPEEVTGHLFGNEFLPLEEEVRFRTLTIRPIRTQHGDLEHYSYLVTWHGLKLFFTGDTTDYDAVLRVDGIDVLFVTPWVARRILKQGLQIPGKKKVIYHHRGKGIMPGCGECLWPERGDGFQLMTAQ